MSSTIQTTLFREPTTWTLVDEHPENPNGYGVDCPDCGGSCDVGLFPLPSTETAVGVHGFGCNAYQNVVPSGVGMGVGDGYEVETVDLRSGETVDAMVVSEKADERD